MNKPVLIAFDFDGVIADSIQAMKNTFYSFLQLHHIAYSDAIFEQYNGVKLSGILSDIKKKYNIDTSYEGLLASYQDLLENHMTDIKPVQGVSSVLKN